MHTAESLLDIHRRVHQNLAGLLEHCRALSPAELDRELEGFGYASVRLQLHHIIGAQRYWTGVLLGQMRIEEDDADFPTVAALETLRVAVAAETEAWLRAAPADLDTPRHLVTWSGERQLAPSLIVLRICMHVYHHLGQATAMCRLLGHPVQGLDFPIT
jgi:uncharacterized damage-inducible protein DinB